MNGLPGIFIHDGGLRVLRDNPVRFIVERGLVGFVGDGFAPVADRVAAVLLPVKDIGCGYADQRRRPALIHLKAENAIPLSSSNDFTKRSCLKMI